MNDPKTLTGSASGFVSGFASTPNNEPPQMAQCRCIVVALDFHFAGASVTFKCDQHGEITIDRRVNYPLYSNQPNLFTIPNNPPYLAGGTSLSAGNVLEEFDRG